MCTLFEEIAKEGKMKGREEGKEGLLIYEKTHHP